MNMYMGRVASPRAEQHLQHLTSSSNKRPRPSPLVPAFFSAKRVGQTPPTVDAFRQESQEVQSDGRQEDGQSSQSPHRAPTAPTPTAPTPAPLSPYARFARARAARAAGISPAGVTGARRRRRTTTRTKDAALAGTGRFLFHLSCLLTLSYIAFGTCVYHVYAGMTVVDALYFVVVTLTTVGYGDHCAFSDCGQCGEEEAENGECSLDDNGEAAPLSTSLLFVLLLSLTRSLSPSALYPSLFPPSLLPSFPPSLLPSFPPDSVWTSEGIIWFSAFFALFGIMSKSAPASRRARDRKGRREGAEARYMSEHPSDIQSDTGGHRMEGAVLAPSCSLAQLRPALLILPPFLSFSVLLSTILFT